MDSHTLFYELKRLLKSNKKQYMSFFIGVFVLLAGILLLPSLLTDNMENTNHKNNSKHPKENPAVFELYIEYDTGNTFTNTLLLEQAMKTDELIQNAEEQTGVEISELLDYEEQTDYLKTAKDRGVLGASRDSDSNIWIFSSAVGTEKENLAVINYYYELIENNEIELLENKYLYMMSKPRILSDEDLSSPTTLVEQSASQGFTLKNILNSVVLSFVGALVISFVLLIIKTFFTKKIQYAFNYSWSEEDIFTISTETNRKTVQQMLNHRHYDKVLYLSQEPKLLPFDELEAVDTLAKAESIEEVVLFVQPQITDKQWYNQQKELLKLFRLPIKIVQINN